MEQQLIDANYAIALIKDMRDFARADVLRDAIEKIKAAMTVDAVQVVRCKDCKHHEIFKNGVNGWCNKHGSPTDVTYFCADGERRTDEQQT